MTDTPQPPQDRPLVTFALFAYNQEKYIREAVEGAFSQTYEPLEIILSDDCSSDLTYQIMQEMAAKYSGPHTVKTNQQSKNEGLWAHIEAVVHMSSGKYLATSAGDDFSLPNRVLYATNELVQSNAQIFLSSFNEIDAHGILIRKNCVPDNSNHWIWRFVQSDGLEFINGAVAVYSVKFLKSAFSELEPVLRDKKFNYEDVLFTAFAIATKADIIRNNLKSLVNYRIQESSLTNFQPKGRGIFRELQIIKIEASRALSQLHIIDGIVHLATKHSHLQSKINLRKLLFERDRLNIEIKASSSVFLVRIKALGKSSNRQQLTIALARLLGSNFHAAVRVLRKKIRRHV